MGYKMTENKRTAREVFDNWAIDYHADGMEKSHWESVKEAFRMIPQSRGNYLELGFGNGYGIKHIATHQFKDGQCYGLDVSPNMVEKAKNNLINIPNVHLNAGDFIQWSPGNNIQFSCIFSMEVFYYFKDIQKGIEKAASLLADGGMLIVLVNHYLENTESHTWPQELDTPMTLWSEHEYQNGFIKAGLENIKQSRINSGKNKPGTLCTVGYK